MQTYNLTGNIATLGAPTASQRGKAYLFGDSIPHFVIGADSTGDGHNVFQDQPLYSQTFAPGSINRDVANFSDGQATLPSSAFTGATYHVGEQATPNVTPATGDFYGYASGIYEQSGHNGDRSVGALYNQSPNDVHLSFKADNSLSALFNLSGAGDNGRGGAKLYFGDWDNAHGRSAAINGKIYAAVESAVQHSKRGKWRQRLHSAHRGRRLALSSQRCTTQPESGALQSVRFHQVGCVGRPAPVQGRRMAPARRDCRHQSRLVCGRRSHEQS